MAQDPLDVETCYDFWRMINDHNSYTLVMLSSEDVFAPQEKVFTFRLVNNKNFN
jgi:hypothetical protein